MGGITVDDMFSPAGLAYYLTGVEDARLAVDVGDYYRPVYITVDDLTCAECGGGIDPPSTAAAKYIAINKALTGGKCRSCLS